MILVIDNFDSFTYNLVNLLKLYSEVVVITPDAPYQKYAPDGVLISPGPGHPLDNDDLVSIIEHFKKKPILGVCLGAQALTCYYGGQVVVGDKVKHGKLDTLTVRTPNRLYPFAKDHFEIMRYHSLVSDPDTFPDCLQITGQTDDAIQSFEHKTRPHFGIQYHPESFACVQGDAIIREFVAIVEQEKQKAFV